MALEQDKDENEQIALRRAKLSALREQGRAFPNDFRRDALAAQLHDGFGERGDEWLAANPTRVSVSSFSRIPGTALNRSAPASTVMSSTSAMEKLRNFTSSVSRL